MRNTKHDNERHKVSYIDEKGEQVIVGIYENKTTACQVVKAMTAIHENIFSITPESSW